MQNSNINFGGNHPPYNTAACAPSFAQRLRSCSKIRHVKCSEMYLIVILNPKKTKASVEERESNISAWFLVWNCPT
jgi:hypothetical protein